SRASPKPASQGVQGFEPRTLEDRWILSRFNRVAKDVADALASYRFHDAANRIYDFFWGDFCDWYLELIKPRLLSESGNEASTACTNLVNLLEASLRLLHPIMPFITEEIWQAIYDGNPPIKSIALASYPQCDDTQVDLTAETEMAVLQDLIVAIRNLRAELKVETKLKTPVEIHTHDAETRQLIEQNRGSDERLATVEGIAVLDPPLSQKAGVRSTSRFDVHVVYERKIDIAVERERLNKELDQAEKQIANKEKQLGNQQFLSKAPSHIVAGLRNGLEQARILREKLRQQLKELR